MVFARRSLLIAASGATVALSGCLDEDSSIGEATPSDEATEIVDIDYETGVETELQYDDEPVVEYDESGEIRVTGTYIIGNSCYDETFPTPTYDEGADTLRVEASRRHDGTSTCDDIAQIVSYRIVVTVTGPLPGTLEVTEDQGGVTVVNLD